MNEAVTESIQNAYSILDQLNISVTGLIVIAIVFSLAFLFAVREAAAWFFKIDDLKRDIKRLNLSMQQTESEIRVLQNLLLKSAGTADESFVSPTEDRTISPIDKNTKGAAIETAPLMKSAESSGTFPINH